MTIRTPLVPLGALVAVVAAAVAIGIAAAPAPAAAATSLSPAESAALVRMREEEKLARDVYLALAAKWSLPVFANIARSEQQHMDAVGVLLARYGIADPAAAKARGAFADPELRTLYRALVADGSRSPAAALAVGVRIETLDIADLQERLPQVTHPDIRFVFNRLLQGSQNHLRAFSR